MKIRTGTRKNPVGKLNHKKKPFSDIIFIQHIAQRCHVTSDTLGREFDPGKRVFSH